MDPGCRWRNPRLQRTPRHLCPPLLQWFEQHWRDVEVVSEGLDDAVVVGPDPQWTVIVDTIDGTRGLMYDKRSAWCLAAAAPRGGTLRDISAAVMTELPTVKQGASDQLSGIRGGGVIAERLDLSVTLVSHHLRLLRGARLVKGDRQGKQIFYAIADQHVSHVLQDMATHISEDHADD